MFVSLAITTIGAQYALVCFFLLCIIAFSLWKRKELEFPVLKMNEVMQGWGI